MKEKLFSIEMKFREVPDWADIYTMEEFIDHVKCGGIMNYDGFGYLAISDEKGKVWESNIEVNCQVSWLYGQPIDFTHVCWYNK